MHEVRIRRYQQLLKGGVERCSAHFQNAFFAMLHTLLYLMFIYCRHNYKYHIASLEIVFLTL
jgi:hypothetical protein